MTPSDGSPTATCAESRIPPAAAKQGARDVGEDVRRVHARAQAVRTGLVGADRAQLEPHPRAPKHELAGDRHRDRRDEGHRDPADVRLDRVRDAGPVEALRLWAQEQGDALDRDVGREGRKHGREAEGANERPVRQADRNGGADHGEHSERELAAALTCPHEEREHDHDEPGERPHRQVDAGPEEHRELAQADEHQRARQQQHALEVEPSQEMAVLDGGESAEGEHDRGQGHARQVVARREPPRPKQARNPAGALVAVTRGRRDRRAGDVLFRDLLGFEGADEAPPREDDDAVAEPLQLDRVGREHDHRHSAVGGGAEHLVQLEARAGIDAACGLVGEQHLRVGEKGTGEEHLLLVAARQGRDRRLRRGGANVELRDPGRDLAVLAAALDDAGAGELRQGEERGVLAHAQREHHALTVTVPRQVDDPGPACPLRPRDVDRASGDLDRSLSRVKPCEGADHFVLPVSDHAGKAQDLARLDSERHVVDVRAVQRVDFEQGRAPTPSLPASRGTPARRPGR